jgi:hypothetical protein
LVKPFVTSLLYLFIYILATYNRYDIALYIIYVLNYIVHCRLDYMPSIARMPLYSSIRSYNAHSLISWVSGQHHVSVVLRCCLPTNAPYIPDHVVDRGSDTPIETFVVHSPNIGQVRPGCEGRLTLFLIFLSNVPCVYI